MKWQKEHGVRCGLGLIRLKMAQNMDEKTVKPVMKMESYCTEKNKNSKTEKEKGIVLEELY